MSAANQAAENQPLSEYITPHFWVRLLQLELKPTASSLGAMGIGAHTDTYTRTHEQLLTNAHAQPRGANTT